jgi:hypothetical protein
MIQRLGRGLALALAVCLLAALAAACGGSSDGSTVSESSAETSAESETASGESAESGSGGGPSEVLAGLSTPSGSTLLGSKESANVVYQHYKTSTEPKEVESYYDEQLTSAGWSIESSGGGGGGWGSYGGSDYGLTAKREEDYFDLEAGGEKSHTSYFEICAGPGSRSECEEMSENENESSSGGSGGNEESESESGGS